MPFLKSFFRGTLPGRMDMVGKRSRAAGMICSRKGTGVCGKELLVLQVFPKGLHATCVM
jgi:hypothetical protein